MSSTTNYNLVKPTDNEAADIGVINANMEIIDTNLKSLESGKEAVLKSATEKTALVDADSLPLLDSSDSSKTKKISFTNMKSLLKTYFDTLYNKTLIVNNLTTTTAGNALDAVQGKSLANSISVISTTLANQSKAENISISSTMQALYGVANVDAALQKNFPKTERTITFTSSQIWTAPNGVSEVDIYMVGGGQGGGNGTIDGMGSAGGLGGDGGDGGKIVYAPKFKITEGSSMSVVIGAGGASGGGAGGDTSFGRLTTLFSFCQQPKERRTKSNKSAITTIQSRVSETYNNVDIYFPIPELYLVICPLNEKLYGLRGNSGGSTQSNANTYWTAGAYAFNAFGYSINNSAGIGIQHPSYLYEVAGGGGSSANNAGGNATLANNMTGAGMGGNANPNTGNGGGGGGATTRSDKMGIGGVGGSGIVIIKYYA